MLIVLSGRYGTATDTDIATWNEEGTVADSIIEQNESMMIIHFVDPIPGIEPIVAPAFPPEELYGRPWPNTTSIMADHLAEF